MKHRVTNYMVRPLWVTELVMLTGLFDYNDVDAMLAENAREMEAGRVEIFGLFQEYRLIGELHVKYESEDEREAIRDRRAYLFAFRVHEDFQNLGIGKYLLRSVVNVLTAKGYKELTVGVEDDNARAIHMYQSMGFTEVIARKYEEYQGDGYEYNLYLRREVQARDFIFVIGAIGIGKSTLVRKLYEHYRSAYVEQNQAPEFESFDGHEGVSGIAEEEICWKWVVSTLKCYHELGLKNIIADDFDDLRTRDIPEVFKGYNYITIKLVCSDYQQNLEQMKNRGEGLIDFELLEKMSEKINRRNPLVNEFVIDVAGKSPQQVLEEAVELIDHAQVQTEYEYVLPPREAFYSWVYANQLRG